MEDIRSRILADLKSSADEEYRVFQAGLITREEAREEPKAGERSWGCTERQRQKNRRRGDSSAGGVFRRFDPDQSSNGSQSRTFLI